MKYRPPLFALLLTLPAALLPAAQPALEALLPVKPEIRKILNQSCVMCHGEVIDGQQETRDDVDLSTDDAIRNTVSEVGRLKLPDGAIKVTDVIIRDAIADILRKKKGSVDPAKLFSPTTKRLDYEGGRPVECAPKTKTGPTDQEPPE